jgi:1-acyl-sn-glycerol-3-phosphate acyltransferase
MFFIKVNKIGFENLQPGQSYVITCNHQSIIDIFLVYGWLPSIFKWVLKAELRKIPFIGWACQAAKHIFIDRSNPVAARRSIERAKLQLQNGVSVVIFPEGTRSNTGSMNKFKKGAFRIATDLSLPILPITLKGLYGRMSRRSFKVTPGTVEIIMHKPIDVKNYADNMQQLIDDTWQILNNSLK